MPQSGPGPKMSRSTTMLPKIQSTLDSSVSPLARYGPLGVTLSASVPFIQNSTVKSPAPTSAGAGRATRPLYPAAARPPPLPPELHAAGQEDRRGRGEETGAPP